MKRLNIADSDVMEIALQNEFFDLRRPVMTIDCTARCLFVEDFRPTRSPKCLARIRRPFSDGYGVFKRAALLVWKIVRKQEDQIV